MAFDEAMLEYAAEGRTLVRFYGWEPWCLSLGRNQPAPARLRGRLLRDIRPGVDAVRRPTGGRSVFHGPEITYAFACPDRAWGGPRQVLRAVHRALADGLRSLGVPVDDLPKDARQPPGSTEPFALSAAACFRDPAPGELTVGGRKLVGSAQRRRRGGVLQHGSILLEDRQALADLEDPGGPRRSPEAPERRLAVGLRETISATPDTRAIVRRLEETLTREFGPVASSASTSATVAALDRVAAGYMSGHRSAARLRRGGPGLFRRAPGVAPSPLDAPAGRL